MGAMRSIRDSITVLPLDDGAAGYTKLTGQLEL